MKNLASRSRRTLGKLLFFAGACVLPSTMVLGGSINVEAENRGWYTDFGLHLSGNPSYYIGDDGEALYRNFFVFEIPVFSETVTGATLKLWNPPNGFFSQDPSETYELFAVSTPIEDLVSDQFSATDIYENLGSGLSFGSITLSDSDNDNFVVLTLNATFLSALNAAQGMQLAIGGALTTLTPGDDAGAFIGTESEDTPPPVLTVQTVPEPATAVLLLGAGVGLLASTRKRAAARA